MTPPTINHQPSPSAIARLLPSPAQVADDLKPLAPADYDRAIALFVEAMAVHPGVRFLGQFGTVSTPGVSDLDLLVVAADEHYRAVCDQAFRVVQNVPNGPYLFWHPPAVIPLSLLPVTPAFHSLGHLRPLHGHVPLPAECTAPLSAIRTVLWSSYFWSSVLSLSRGRPGLRQLLLLLGNIAQSIGWDYHALGQAAERERALRRARESRQAVLAAPPSQRADLAVQHLAQALEAWLDADWNAQPWWNRCLASQPSPALRLRTGPDTLIEFRHERDSSQSPAVTLTLPSFYADLILLLKPSFGPRFHLPGLDKTQVPDRQSLDVSWQEALSAFKAAAESIRRFSHRIGLDELALFREPFALPFGLYPVPQSGISWAKALARALFPWRRRTPLDVER